jgi:hypothetical protein
MDGPRPSTATAPSIWYADEAAPKTKPAGNWGYSMANLWEIDIVIIVTSWFDFIPIPLPRHKSIYSTIF